MFAAGPAAAQDPPRLPASVTFVTSGGHWQDGPSHGHYRLVVLRADPVSATSRLQIEWIEEGARGDVVRESRAATVLADPWTLESPRFLAGGARTTASVAGSDLASGRQAHWTIRLGPPGRFAISPLR